MVDFEFIDHTADVGIIAYGRDYPEVFSHAASAMFSLIADLSAIRETVSREISVNAVNRAELLVAWLNELLYFCDAERLLFSRFDITRMDDLHLEAVARGEPIDPIRHDLKTQVKAATYHLLKMEKTREGFRAQVILDI